MTYTLILLYFFNGNPTIAMETFGTQSQCQTAGEAAKSAFKVFASEIRYVCVSNGR